MRIGQACLDHAVRHQLFQVFCRARLHARRDFFGEEFDQDIRHFVSPV